MAWRAAPFAFLIFALAFAHVAGAEDVPPGAVVAALPFESSTEPNRIVVNLAPEGSAPFAIILDTGANTSVLTPLAARKLGVSVSRTKSDPYRRSTRLGTDLQFYVDTRQTDTGSKTGWEYGLLGGNFLHQYVLDIDFGGRLVRFLDPARYAVAESGAAAEEAVLPLGVVANRPSVEIRVNGHPVRVMVDTGSEVPLLLSGAAAQQAGIDVDALPAFGKAGSVLGPMEVRMLESADVELGPMRFSSVPVLVAPRGWYNQAGATDSAIGYDLLSRFHVRVDYERARMWLHREDAKVPFLGVDYAATKASGALLCSAGHLRLGVLRVTPETPAAKLGLKPGDQLMTENPDGGVRTPAQIIEAIRAGQRVRVAREMNHIWVDLDLPDDPLLQSQPGN